MYISMYLFVNVMVSSTSTCSCDCLCYLVVRVPGYKCRCPGLIFREVVGQERGPLSLVITIEVLLGRKSSGSGLEIREYGRRDPSR
jgi:hypothetical protein